MPTALLAPLDVIALMRRSRPDAVEYFMHGHCYELFCILRLAFPCAQPYHTYEDQFGHVATKIGGDLYDIRGRILRPHLYEPIRMRSRHRPHRWSKDAKALPAAPPCRLCDGGTIRLKSRRCLPCPRCSPPTC